MPSFVLLLHEHPEDYAEMSPAEMQAIVERYQAWSQGLAAAGKLSLGEKLTDDGGRQLTRAGSRTIVTDGPYAEAAEVIGGLFIVIAADYAEAERIAADCPHLGHKRNRIELRQVDALA